MKKLKQSISILLTLLMLAGVLSVVTITSDASSKTYFHPGIVTDSGYWYAWTWGNGTGEGHWVKGQNDENDGTVTFKELLTRVVFVLMSEDLYVDEMDGNSWGYTIHQSDDLDVDNTDFTATKWTKHNEAWDSDNFSGEWSDGSEYAKQNDSEKPASGNSESNPKEDIDSSAFTILNPTETGTYYKNEEIEITVGISKFYYSYSANGLPISGSNTIKLEIIKGTDVATYTFNYGEEDVGEYLTGHYVPYSSGNYTVKEYYQDEYVGSFDFYVNENSDNDYEDEDYDYEDEEYEEEYDDEKYENSLQVDASVKSIVANVLKKSSKTIKPLKFVDYDGNLTVVKQQNGTSSSIYNKITVKKATGAIVFNKGSYKKGTYKIRLKITASGNSSYEPKTLTLTVKVKIIPKKNNPVKLKGKVKSLYISSLAKGDKTYRPITVYSAKGKVTFAKYKKNSDSSIFKKIKVNKKNGAITIKKGNYTKGTYTVQIKVTVKGNDAYKSKKLIKAVKIKFKNKAKKKKTSTPTNTTNDSTDNSTPSSSQHTCPLCSGRGTQVCYACGGRGVFNNWGGNVTFCSTCNGRAYINCSRCGGTGYVYY